MPITQVFTFLAKMGIIDCRGRPFWPGCQNPVYFEVISCFGLLVAGSWLSARDFHHFWPKVPGKASFGVVPAKRSPLRGPRSPVRAGRQPMSGPGHGTRNREPGLPGDYAAIRRPRGMSGARGIPRAL